MRLAEKQKLSFNINKNTYKIHLNIMKGNNRGKVYVNGYDLSLKSRAATKINV